MLFQPLRCHFRPPLAYRLPSAVLNAVDGLACWSVSSGSVSSVSNNGASTPRHVLVIDVTTQQKVVQFRLRQVATEQVAHVGARESAGFVSMARITRPQPGIALVHYVVRGIDGVTNQRSSCEQVIPADDRAAVEPAYNAAIRRQYGAAPDELVGPAVGVVGGGHLVVHPALPQRTGLAGQPDRIGLFASLAQRDL